MTNNTPHPEPWIGTTRYIRSDLGPILCIIRDKRTVWGRDDILIRPAAAHAVETWVSADRLVSEPTSGLHGHHTRKV